LSRRLFTLKPNKTSAATDRERCTGYKIAKFPRPYFISRSRSAWLLSNFWESFTNPGNLVTQRHQTAHKKLQTLRCRTVKTRSLYLTMGFNRYVGSGRTDDRQTELR